MPQVKFAPAAIRHLERLRAFLRAKHPPAAKRAAKAIIKTIDLLEQQPQMGRPVKEMGTAYRELLIDFGDAGYVALYRYEGDIVTVLAIRHQREAGY